MGLDKPGVFVSQSVYVYRLADIGPSVGDRCSKAFCELSPSDDSCVYRRG